MVQARFCPTLGTRESLKYLATGEQAGECPDLGAVRFLEMGSP